MVMNGYLIPLAVIVAFLFMEFTAWFTHKYVMHGFLWVLHKDHHYPTGKKMQLNDLFALIFAVPSIILIISGSMNQFGWGFWTGIGIAAYGIAYFVFHDLLVHRRLPLFKKVTSSFLRAIITAHYDHHSGKENYGFIFFIPWRYFGNVPPADEIKTY